MLHAIRPSCRCWSRCHPLGAVDLPLRRAFSVSKNPAQVASQDERLSKTRNLGIIAHIDAGKTTTTERMLYYSGFTRRIGDVDDGSTVTDFLPAERARGITIQSAAITFHWPPSKGKDGSQPNPLPSHTLNLIDTPGHADFTFEVIRSLRVLDGAICILDGVAGVEAQTEKVWHQAGVQQIPRLIYVNKLDRDGAAFHRTVKEIASRLHVSPALCQIPWWKDGRFIGVGDVINYTALSWENGGDGAKFDVTPISVLKDVDKAFADELYKARVALIESLTEYDEVLVEQFLESDEDWEGLSAQSVVQSLRRILMTGGQKVAPVFAGASFRNIGVQPLLDSVTALLPAPTETNDPRVSLGANVVGLRKLVAGEVFLDPGRAPENAKKKAKASPAINTKGLTGLGLAFKVVTDPRRGVLVYVRVYSGSISRNALLYNTNLSTSERAQRLLRMYASDAVEIESIEEGQIGVIAGLKHARTGDTLIVFQGMSSKAGPPAPLNTAQLQPINVPPPLFFASIEPNSLAEAKNLEECLSLLLREDPSLKVSTDPESGQTHLAGMGELHLEIARDRLLTDFKAKARMGKIEISYRESIVSEAGPVTETFEKEVAGKSVAATAVASVTPLEDVDTAVEQDTSNTSHVLTLSDGNLLTIIHPAVQTNGKPTDAGTRLPPDLPLRSVISSLQSGVAAALARGPTYTFPVHSVHIRLDFDAAICLAPNSTPAALTAAARLATKAALRQSVAKQNAVLMEPVMLADIAVTEDSLGSVVHDLTSARGAQVLSLDAEPGEDTAQAGIGGTAGREELETKLLTPAQIDKVYAPPDPFGGEGGAGASDETKIPRLIRARVPLKEMVGYLKHLRSLTGGRGTFVMGVDRFEKMNSQRVKAALAEMHGDLAP